MAKRKQNGNGSGQDAARKLSRRQTIALTTEQENAHLASTDIIRMRTVEAAALAMLDEEISALTQKLSDRKAERDDAVARIEGYTQIIAKR